jgi:hypothetical protein
VIDQRNFDELKVAHPMPWRFVTVPGIQSGMARIIALDAPGKEVPLSVLMRVIDIITMRAAAAPTTP